LNHKEYTNILKRTSKFHRGSIFFSVIGLKKVSKESTGSGWVIEKTPSLTHDFFFHHGKKDG